MAKPKPEARSLTQEEMGQWGVFLSHSSDSNVVVEDLCKVMDDYGIHYLWDKQIAVGASDFSSEIISMIDKCTCAVLIISAGALSSQWVNFEIGYLKGLGKKVFLYDPDCLMENRNYRFHYDPDCPGYSSSIDLAKAVSEEKVFYSLFNNETKDLSADLFRRQADENLVPIHIETTVPGLEKIDPKSYQLKTLIIEFGSYTGCRYCEDSICSQNGDDIDNDICEYTDTGCCLNREPDRSIFPECVLLNHVWSRMHVSGDTIELNLPLHKFAGTTFKIFVDTPSGKTADALMKVFAEAGLKPGLAAGGDQNRIYITLRNNRMHGIFDLEAEFSNNFICPGALQL